MRNCVCGVPLIKKPGPGRWPHYCSDRCRLDENNRRIRVATTRTHICTVCGDAFAAATKAEHPLCSAQCRGRYAQAHRSYQGGPITYKETAACEACGRSVRAWTGGYRPVRFCVDCRSVAASARHRETYVPTSHEKVCVECGASFVTGAGKRIYCSKSCSWRVSHRRRRGMKKANGRGVYTTHGVAERDRWICGICSHIVPYGLRYPDPESASVDHILPLALGGSDLPENVQLAHLGCNRSKGARVA